MRERWREEVHELKRAGRYKEASALLHEAMKAGDISAHVMLARMGSAIDLSHDEANQLVDYVAANMDPQDVDAHWELSRAYDLRLGSIPYEEKAARSLYHLAKAAELGSGVIDTLAVARIYREGTLGVEPDLDESVRWYKRAIEQGCIDAVHELQKVYRQQATVGRKQQAAVVRMEGRRKPRSKS